MPNLAHAYIRHARYYYAVVRVADKLWLQGDEDSEHGLELFDLQLPVGRWVDWLETAFAAARMLKYRESKGIRLNQLGGAHSNLGNPDETVKCYEQALAIPRELGDQHGEGVYLRNLGSAYADDVGDTQKDIACGEQALAMARNVGDRSLEESVLGQLGNAHAYLEETSQAIEYFEQALAMPESLVRVAARQIG